MSEIWSHNHSPPPTGPGSLGANLGLNKTYLGDSYYRLFLAKEERGFVVNEMAINNFNTKVF